MRPTRPAPCDTEPDASVLRVAARQHGVITRPQAICNGLTRSMIETRIRRGQLRRIHHGVYGIGGSPQTFEQRAFAATGWAGPGAAVSHSSAAHLWNMLDGPPAAIDVCTPRRRTRPPPTVCVHFTRSLSPRDRGTLRNIPVTSPVRTLIDLAGVLPEPLVEAALTRAITERRVTAQALGVRVAAMSRQGVAGPRILRKLLMQGAGRWHAGSPLERRVAEALAGPDLPPFRREHPVYLEDGVYYLDFAWPHFRVAVEADGRRWHSDPGAFESDRERHNALTAAGWKVLRVTDRQVRLAPQEVRRQVVDLVAPQAEKRNPSTSTASSDRSSRSSP